MVAQRAFPSSPPPGPEQHQARHSSLQESAIQAQVAPRAPGLDPALCQTQEGRPGVGGRRHTAGRPAISCAERW